MKKMTCKQLGGACDLEFFGDTFVEVANQSKKHGMEMFQIGDSEHLSAMKDMQKMMENPANFSAWFESKKEEFNQANLL